MPTFILQVVGHGQDQGKGTFPASPEWKFKFFVQMGQILDDAIADQIYIEMEANNLDSVNHRVLQTYFEGADIVNYAIWDLDDANYTSGILLPGSTDAVVDIRGTTEQDPIFLVNLLALAVETLEINVGVDEVIVYFNACR